MSIHIGAKKDEIAETVLLPGDPLRAKFIADTFLENVVMYSKVRGMYGFTGFYKGKRLSVQGTGMGVPSISIYVNELINDYDVQKLMRIGTCGAIQNDIELKDVILGMAASTDSSLNKIRFDGMDYAPIADFELLNQAYQYAMSKGKKVKVGNIPHPMTEEHYIEWIELHADNDKVYIEFLKPGKNPEASFQVEAQKVVAKEYCNLHGLWESSN